MAASSSTPSRTWLLVDNRSRPIRSVIGLPGDYISVPEMEEIQTDAMELPTLVQLLAPRQGRQWCTHASDITSIVSLHHSKMDSQHTPWRTAPLLLPPSSGRFVGQLIGMSCLPRVRSRAV